MTEFLSTHELNAVYGIIILAAGFFLAGLVKRILKAALGKIPHFDNTLEGFFSSLVKYFIITVTILMALSKFGVQTASLIAVFGAASLAIGLALQDTLKSLAAGVMLLMFRPFKVGDYAEVGGQTGTVKDISLFVTVLATLDNIKIIVPNADIWGRPIRNFTGNATRRADVSVGIGYGEDIGKAVGTVEDVIKKDDRILNDPEPQIIVDSLGDSAVNLSVRAWVRRDDLLPVKSDLLRNIKEAFDKKGIEIPFPQRVVHTAPEKKTPVKKEK